METGNRKKGFFGRQNGSNKFPSSAASPATKQRRLCMCSPTTHPGSFRCSLHRNGGSQGSGYAARSGFQLNGRKVAVANSLLRNGEWAKRALTIVIRPSSHQIRRSTAFQPRPSRLRFMSRADEAAFA